MANPVAAPAEKPISRSLSQGSATSPTTTRASKPIATTQIAYAPHFNAHSTRLLYADAA